jgi:hypothetical protein
MMKKIMLVFSILAVHSILAAQPITLIIHLKDGSTSAISMKNISEIFFDDIDAKVLKNPRKIQMLNNLVLFQNYPNPFNSETTIKYSLRKPGDVNIDIYNIMGKTVKSYSYDNQEPGEYAVNWDGKDQRGDEVASGVYFYQLHIDDEIKSRSMILVK